VDAPLKFIRELFNVEPDGCGKGQERRRRKLTAINAPRMPMI
jgi:hypothetical protein